MSGKLVLLALVVFFATFTVAQQQYGYASYYDNPTCNGTLFRRAALIFGGNFSSCLPADSANYVCYPNNTVGVCGNDTTCTTCSVLTNPCVTFGTTSALYSCSFSAPVMNDPQFPPNSAGYTSYGVNTTTQSTCGLPIQQFEIARNGFCFDDNTTVVCFQGGFQVLQCSNNSCLGNCSEIVSYSTNCTNYGSMTPFYVQGFCGNQPISTTSPMTTSMMNMTTGPVPTPTTGMMNNNTNMTTSPMTTSMMMNMTSGTPTTGMMNNMTNMTTGTPTTGMMNNNTNMTTGPMTTGPATTGPATTGNATVTSGPMTTGSNRTVTSGPAVVTTTIVTTMAQKSDGVVIAVISLTTLIAATLLSF